MEKDWASESTGDTGGFQDKDEHDAILEAGRASAWEQDDPPKPKKKRIIKKRKR